MLIAGVGALNMLHSTAYLAHSHAQGRFFAAFTVMIAGLLGMTQAKDIFSFFGFWELMSSWALWAAINARGNRRGAARGLQITSCSTQLVPPSCSWAWPGWRRSPAASSWPPRGPGAAGAADRAGDSDGRADLRRPGHEGGAVAGAHRLSDASGARAHAGVRLHLRGAAEKLPWGVLKLFIAFGGTVLFARMGGTIGGQPVLLTVISTIAGITILYAGAMAMVQNGIKLLLIYSTVCQLGYVLLGVSLATPLGIAGGLHTSLTTCSLRTRYSL